MFIIAFSNSGYLYAQEAGDTADDPLEVEGDGVVIVPGDDELAALLTETQHRGAVVGPLLQTKWGQGAPYKNMLPAGHRSFCNLVAASQIMKYHNHPVRGKGKSETYTMKNGAKVPSLNFNISYDWKNMLTGYRSDGKDSTLQQQNAVATLIYHAGVARGRDFTDGSVKFIWPVVFTTTFGYDKSIQLLYRRFYTDAEWEAIVKAQLDVGLPVLYNGRNQAKTTNHYVVIDGYDNTGKFHINFGWSGKSDGWYSLNELKTGTKNYSYHQCIVINIKPDKGGKSTGYEMALTELIAGKTSIPQNELFTVNMRMRNNSALDSFPGGQLGVALVDAAGKIIEIIGSGSRATLKPQSTSSSKEVHCIVPAAIKPGQYRMMSVIRPEGGNWNVISRSAIGEGIPNSLTLTVSAGDAKGGGYGIVLENFSSEKTIVGQKDKFAVTAKPRNRGADRLTGQIGAALIDNSGNIVSVIGSKNLGLGAGNQTTSTITCTVPATVKSGQYRLRIVIRPNPNDEWRVATLSLPDIPNSIKFEVK